MKILVIANPHAGSGTTRRRIHGLMTELRRRAEQVRLEWTMAPGGAGLVAQRSAGDYDAILAAGGDGTLNEVVCGLMAAGIDVPVAVAPYGSGNDYARLIGMPSRPSSIAEVLLSASVRVMDVGEVEWTSARDDGSRIFVNAMGCGVDALVARVVSQAATVKGRGRYLAAIRKAVKEWQHPVTDIRTDRSTWSAEMLLCTAAIGKTTGGGVRLTPHAEPDDGLLDVCLAPRLSLGRLVQLLPRAAVGRHTGAREVTYEASTMMSVHAPAGVPVHLDGELLPFNVRELRVRVLPRRLRVITPPGR